MVQSELIEVATGRYECEENENRFYAEIHPMEYGQCYVVYIRIYNQDGKWNSDSSGHDEEHHCWFPSSDIARDHILAIFSRVTDGRG